MPALNDIISGNQQGPNQVTYTKISEQPDSTTKVVRKVVTSQQPGTTESTYYAKKITTTTTTTRGSQGPTNQTSSTRYSNTTTSRNQPNSYSRPVTQTSKTTTTTTTTTVQRGQYGQNARNLNTNSNQYRSGIQKNTQPSSRTGNTQSYSANKYEPKRSQQSTSYNPKAKSPEPGSIKRKTINRGDPVENVQITHIIYSSGPAEFHITEILNLDNLKSGPIQISKADRERLQKSGKVSATCSCDGVEIAQPKKPNLQGTTLHYQHAQGLGMTNDKNENLNPMFYSSEIKKLDPISKSKDQEKIENVENFRSNGKVFDSPSPNKSTTKTPTSNKYNQSQNYRGGATNTSTNIRESSTSGRGGMASTSGRGGNSSINNRGGAGTSVKTTTTYTRGSNVGSGGDGEIIKDTRTKVQMGSRSYKNTSQPTTYTTTERKVYTQKNFFNK